MAQKLCITTILVMLTMITYGQTDKGSIMLSGGASMSFVNGNNSVNQGNAPITRETFRLDINPSVGYFLTKGLVVGPYASYGRAKFDDVANQRELIEHYYILGPYGRYYFNNGIFVMGSIGLGKVNTDIDGIDSQGLPYQVSVQEDFFQWQAGAGYAIFLNRNIALEPYVTYNRRILDSVTEDDQTLRKTIFAFGVAINVFLWK